MTQPDPVPPLPSTPTLGYASGIHPPAEGIEVESGTCFRADSSLVVTHGSTLPPRCILCGGDGFRLPIKLTFTWDSSFKIARISTLQLRQKAYVHAYLCALHRARWASARLFGGIGIVASIGTMMGGSALGVYAESFDLPAWTPVGIGFTIAGFAALICSLFFFTLRSRTLSCSKIQEGYLYLEGASPRFLAHLPPVSGKM